MRFTPRIQQRPLLNSSAVNRSTTKVNVSALCRSRSFTSVSLYVCVRAYVCMGVWVGGCGCLGCCLYFQRNMLRPINITRVYFTRGHQSGRLSRRTTTRNPELTYNRLVRDQLEFIFRSWASFERIHIRLRNPIPEFIRIVVWLG